MTVGCAEVGGGRKITDLRPTWARRAVLGIWENFTKYRMTVSAW